MYSLVITEKQKSSFWENFKQSAENFWRLAKGERINFLSHLLGACLSLVGLVLLFRDAYLQGEWNRILGFGVYGISLVLMYSSSTVYHASVHPKRKKVLQLLDHCSIYLLIAGTYTPFMLITLREGKGFLILSIIWTIAILGIAFKLVWKDRFDLLATLGYLAAGWLIVLDWNAFYAAVPQAGFQWIVAGGVLYSIGAIFYLFEKLPRNHEIWHFFVLFASFCHFLAIYLYV